MNFSLPFFANKLYLFDKWEEKVQRPAGPPKKRRKKIKGWQRKRKGKKR